MSVFELTRIRKKPKSIKSFENEITKYQNGTYKDKGFVRPDEKLIQARMIAKKKAKEDGG